MSGTDFFDTNVLVYAHQPDDPRKQQIARGLLRQGLASKSVISAQVLSEFATTLLHKASPRATPQAVIDILDGLSPLKLVSPDNDLIRRAIEVHEAYGLHFYDGMIIAAAERAGCERILSEDLNAGQNYLGVTVVNPFH